LEVTPLVNFGDIVRGRWPAEFSPTSGTIFSWLMNNYWGANFPSWQGGDFTFRYSLTSGSKLDVVAEERFGLEQMVPLEKTDVPASAGLSTLLPVNEGSLLQLDNPNVVISTWKMAEDGNGMIVRLQELSRAPSHARLESKHWTLAEAWQSSSQEDNLAKLPVAKNGVEIALRPFQVITLRLTSFQPQ
jgi:alpha-mannosidase